jgi:hypothetical protein
MITVNKEKKRVNYTGYIYSVPIGPNSIISFPGLCISKKYVCIANVNCLLVKKKKKIKQTRNRWQLPKSEKAMSRILIENIILIGEIIFSFDIRSNINASFSSFPIGFFYYCARGTLCHL